jgi:hypothetical protein
MPVSGNQAAKPWDGAEGKPTVQSILPAGILYCSVGLVPNGFHRIYRVQTDNEEASNPY